MLKLWLFSLCLTCLYSYTQTQAVSGQCGCPNPDSFHNIFCDSDFVLQIYVKKRSFPDPIPENTQLSYKIEIVEVFKLKKKRVNKSSIMVPVLKTCNLMYVNKVYIVSGKIWGKQLVMDGCHMISEAKDTPCNIFKNLRKKYQCDCKVEFCNNQEECQARAAVMENDGTSDTCLNRVSNYKCFFMHTACTKTDGQCSWGTVPRTEPECKDVNFVGISLGY